MNQVSKDHVVFNDLLHKIHADFDYFSIDGIPIIMNSFSVEEMLFIKW